MLNNAFIWATIGIILLTIEMFVPGIYMLWIGIAALITAVAAFVLPSLDAWLLVVFALSTVASAVVGTRIYARMHQQPTQLNDMRGQLIGQRGVCIAVGTANQVRIRVSGVEWSALADGTIDVDDEIVVMRFEGSMPVVRGA
jgi:membrane protein implicated in regulation of membrane protease activity